MHRPNEPQSSSQYIVWHEKNCETCARYHEIEGTMEIESDSCPMEDQYNSYAYLGIAKPSEDVLDIMFGNQYCKEWKDR